MKQLRSLPRRVLFAKRVMPTTITTRIRSLYTTAPIPAKRRKIADLLGVGTVKKNDGTYSFTGDYLVVVGQDWK